MKVEEKTIGIIKDMIDGLISDSIKFAGIENTLDDFRVYIDLEASEVAIMFLDGPDKDSWSGHLYELKDEKLEIIEYGAFDFVDISQWPCCNYKELNVTAMSLAVENGIKVGNRYRIDHLCSDNDREVLDIDFEKGEVTLKECLYGTVGRHSPEPFTVSMKFVADEIGREQWYRWILIDNDRNDIK